MALDRKTLRKALNNWDQSKLLGGSPLSRLVVVEVRRQQSGYGDTPAGRGIALREVIQAAIDELKPNKGDADPLDKAWRPYRILAGRYMRGRSAEYLASEMGIARSTYNHELAAALDRVIARLQEHEEYATSRPRTEFGPALGAVPFTVPPRPPQELVGREELLARMMDQLQVGERLAAYGLPGVGKSALAIELGHRLKERFDHGVLWTSLGPRPDIAVQFHLWEFAMGLSASEVREFPNLQSRASQLHSLIGNKRLLLIIDDVWEEAEARAFEIGGANCGYIFTARSPRIAAALAANAAFGISELDELESRQLLERFVPNQVQDTGWRELLEFVGGLPQALVIVGGALRAAAYSDHPRRLSELLDRLADPEALLSLERARSALDQQPGIPLDEPITLGAIIALSEAALDASGRSALHNLSVLPARPNTFSEGAAIAVSGATTKELDVLVDAGLLEPSGGGRYGVHSTIVEYAHLGSDLAEPVKAMVDHFVQFTEAHSEHLNMLNPELQNIMAALRLADEHNLQDPFVAGANALYPYLEANGLLTEAEDLMDRALENSTGRTQTFLNAGRTAQRLGRHAQAESFFKSALESSDDSSAQCAALLGLGAASFERGEWDEAERRYRRGLAIAERASLAQREAALLTNLGILSVSLGDLDAAEANLDRALGLARAVSDRALLGPILTNLGVIAARKGQFDTASDYFEEAVEIARSDSNRRVMAFLHTNMGAMSHDRGDDERARAEFEASLQLSKELGDAQRICHALASLGALETAKGDFNKAGAYLTEGLDLAQTMTLTEVQTLLLINTAELKRELHLPEEERALLKQARGLAVEIGNERYREIATDRLERVVEVN